MSDQDQKAMVDQIYAFAFELKHIGKTDAQTQQALIEKGLDEETAKVVVDNVNKSFHASAEPESSGFPKWLIYILILIGINVLSAIFDWPFWIW